MVAGARPQGGGRHFLRYPCRRNTGRGGRIRLWKIDAGARGAEPDPGHRRQHCLDGPGDDDGLQRKLAGGQGGHPDDLPGPAGLAGSAHDHRANHRRTPSHAPPGHARGRGDAACQGHDGPRRPDAAADQPLSARVLGRPVPAHRHRAGADPGAQAHHLRRAGVGARRFHSGADHQPAQGPAEIHGAGAYLYCPRPGRRQTHQRPHPGDVPRA